MNKNVANFDEGRVAQMSATFAIMIFLSLTLLFAKQEPEYALVEKLLWTASGLFCAASMRLLDRIFDHDKNIDVIFSIFQVRGRSLVSFDRRWQDGRFSLYFLGWLLFLSAFFYVGIMIFLNDIPLTFADYISLLLFSDIWLAVVFVMMILATISSATREFLFKN